MSRDKLAAKPAGWVTRASYTYILCIHIAVSFLHYCRMRPCGVMPVLVSARAIIEFGGARKCQSHGIRDAPLLETPSRSKGFRIVGMLRWKYIRIVYTLAFYRCPLTLRVGVMFRAVSGVSEWIRIRCLREL